MSYRDKIWGMNGDTGWSPVLPPNGLDGLVYKGAWTRSFDSVEASAGENDAAWIKLGESDWRSYELSVGVTLISGGNVQIPFRKSEIGDTFYMVDFLAGWQALGISRVDNRPGGRGLVKISVVNMEIRRGVEYKLELCVRDASFTTYVDGKLINQVADFEFDRGHTALSVWSAKVRYSNPKIRRIG